MTTHSEREREALMRSRQVTSFLDDCSYNANNLPEGMDKALRRLRDVLNGNNQGFDTPPRAAEVGEAVPIPMVLHCPSCGFQHIDKPDLDRNPHARMVGDPPYWDNPPHRSRLCHGCGFIWRPADVPTTGVQAVQTRGTRDHQATANSAEGKVVPEAVIIDAMEHLPNNRAATRHEMIRAFALALSATAREKMVVDEELTKDAARWRYLVAENNKGGLRGKYLICWYDPKGDGYCSTNGVSVNGKDGQAIVRIIDAAMLNATASKGDN